MGLPNWQKKNWIAWSKDETSIVDVIIGYPFGLELHAGAVCEIHGPFPTVGAAMAYGSRLMTFYSAYESCKVVRIETPQAGQTFKRGEGWI